MLARSRKLTAVALSYALAFSPLAPVNFAIAQEASEQEAIELGASDGSGGAVDKTDGSSGDEQVTVLGGEDNRQPDQEAQGQEQPIELANEGEEAAKALDAAAEQTRTLLEGQSDGTRGSGGAIDFSEANGSPRHCDSSEDVTAETKVMESADPYVVRNDVTCAERITVKGDVMLVICNDCTLTCKKGITVAEGGHLMIYRQDLSNSASLECETSGSKVAAISVNAGSKLTINGCYVTATCKTNDGAGIGGDNGKSAGEITINAGVITAKSKMNGAGIGGGKKGDGGKVTINGGDVTAIAGDEDGAGIGGGQEGASGTIAINGGKVYGKGASHGAGIGGGDDSECDSYDKITITGGDVEAKGGAYAAGIGGGGDSGYGTIKISGGTITAKGGTESAGIGSANKGNVDEIDITGGDVIARGAKFAAGIGGGDGKDSNGGGYRRISISGENTKVQAFGGDEAAGIGTGNEAKKDEDGLNSGRIFIKDGADVTAVGGVKDVTINGDRTVIYDDFDPSDKMPKKTGAGEYGAGIGGGDCTDGGYIEISGPGTVVSASGSSRAAGIGGGDDAGGKASGLIHISDGAGKIEANGGERAAGIGGGDEGGFERITIKGGANVMANGGKWGAGIGTGDCSDNATKDAWQSGIIDISGANTVVAGIGGEDGAGIGAGDDGSACDITISDIGQPAGGQGMVLAIGLVGGAGIGGGCAPKKDMSDEECKMHSFNSIDIDNATVTALGCAGAGIGCGGVPLSNYPACYVMGGTIDIEDSNVSAISTIGGAGIGGGTFGFADSINIKGGFTAANGGALQTDTQQMVLGWSLLRNYQDGKLVAAIPPLVWDNLNKITDPLPGVSGWGYFEASWNALTMIFGDGELPGTTFAFQGAGIGGGFAAPGGNITISDNAIVLAASGKLPPEYGLKKMPANAIGVGGHFGTKWDEGGEKYFPAVPPYTPKKYEVEKDERTSVQIYNGARVTTAKIKVTGGSVNGNYNETTMSDFETSVSQGPGADPRVDYQVMTNDYALIDTIPASITVKYDANGGKGTMDDQVIDNADGNGLFTVGLAKNAFTRDGYEFVGWSEYPKGNGTLYSEEQLVSFPSDVTLYARWKGVPTMVHYLVPLTDDQGELIINNIDGKPVYEELDVVEVEKGKATEALSPEHFGKLTFTKWMVGSKNAAPTAGVVYEGGTQIQVDEELYLYAQVAEGTDDTQYCNIQLSSWDYDARNRAVVSVPKGTAYELPRVPFTKKGFVLTGWERMTSLNPPESANEDLVAPGTTVTATDGLIYDAHYRRNAYTLHFDINCGDAQAPADERLIYKYNNPDTEWDDKSVWDNEDDKVTTTLPDDIEREGYKLVGWNTVKNPTEENPGTQYAPGQSVENLSEEDGSTVTLYAQWADSDVSVIKTITFFKNDPDGRHDESYEQLFKVGSTVELDPNKFECANYTFKGWSIEPDGDVMYADGASVTPEGDMTLYAQWDEGKLAEFYYSISLEDSIAISYNVKNLSDSPENYTIEYGFTGAQPTVATLTSQGDNRFTIANCAAKQMSDTVDVVVKHKNADGEETVIKEAQYSIKGYCNALIARIGNSQEDLDKKAVALCKATLDYGTWAQKEFGWRGGSLANDGTDFFDNAAIEFGASDGQTIKRGSCEGINLEKVTFSLVTTSKTQFVVFFPHDAGAKKSDYYFMDAADHEYENVVDRNGKFEVWIDGISAKDLHNMCTFHVAKKSDFGSSSDPDHTGLFYIAAPTDYMAKAAAAGSSPELNRAFYNYYLKAKDYFTSRP